MALNFLLIAGVAAGLCFDVFTLAALCFAIMVVGLGFAVFTGAWQSTMTTALSVFVLQVGYAAGIFVFELDLHYGSNARFTPDS